MSVTTIFTLLTSSMITGTSEKNTCSALLWIFFRKFQASFASTEFIERRLASFEKLSVVRHSFIFDQENGGCRNIYSRLNPELAPTCDCLNVTTELRHCKSKIKSKWNRGYFPTQSTVSRLQHRSVGKENPVSVDKETRNSVWKYITQRTRCGISVGSLLPLRLSIKYWKVVASWIDHDCCHYWVVINFWTQFACWPPPLGRRGVWVIRKRWPRSEAVTPIINIYRGRGKCCWFHSLE